MEYNYPHISDDDVKWNINGNAYDLDLTDDDVLAHYAKCVQEINTEDIRTNSDLTAAISSLFDRLFGTGSGTLILGERPSLRAALNAKNSLMEFARELTSKISAAASHGVFIPPK